MPRSTSTPLEPRCLEACGASLAQGLHALGLAPDPDRERALLRYLALLARWNRVYNLTAVDDPDAMVHRHLLDSLAAVPFLRGGTFVDVGSGAGLPGIPLAIWMPDRHFTLLDRSARKTRFLTQVKIELRLDNVEVVHARAESWRPATGFDGVLSRAFAALPDFVGLAGHLAAPRGTLYAFKGQWPEPETAPLPAPYAICACNTLTIPGDARHRHLVEARRRDA